METYLIKTILASCLFIGFYYLFLEKEKTFKFNRFYLLSSLVLSFLLPLIKIEVQPEIIATQSEIIYSQTELIQNTNIPTKNEINWQTIILVLYALVSISMFSKLIFGIVNMKSLKGKTLIYKGIKTKILEKEISPFSFLNTIYIGKNYFTNEKINNEIFLHEKNHIQAKHSLDLLFVEFTKCLMWFNPAIYLYKKALVDNHEFSADQMVINLSKDVKKYQYLIITEVESQQKFNFSNHFYFNNTKKRIIMMTKRKNPFGKWKNALSLPLLAGITFFTIQKVNATVDLPQIAVSPTETPFNNQNVTNKKENVKDVPKLIIEKSFEKIEDSVPSSTIKTDTIKPKKAITPIQPETPPAPPYDIARDVDKQAEYPSGISQLRKDFMNEFDNAKVEVEKGKKIKVKTEVIFNITENGKVENIRAIGENQGFNQETIRAIEKINNNITWIPAQKDGKNVKSAYKFPITMNFE